MKLMARMQDEAQIADAMRADERAAVHDFGDALQAGGDLDVIDCGVDRWKRAQDALRLHAGFKRRVPLGIERFGLGHAARHPEQDEAVGPRRDLRAARQEARFRSGQRG